MYKQLYEKKYKECLLITDGTFVDWGTMAIGDAPANTWRTPTQTEFSYLLNTRSASTVNGIENAHYAMATVNSVEGNILFPDVYTHPAGVAAINNINAPKANNNGNIISAADWAKMEAAGAVFLPKAGYNERGYTYINTYRACYWTSSPSGSNMANYYLHQSETSVGVSYSTNRNSRFSVRLVHDID